MTNLGAVSCTDTSFCMAVDEDGNALSYNGTTWSSPTSIDNGSGLTSVSCASSSFCMAVDQNGNSFSYNGTWSSLADIDGSRSINSVSCTSSSFCGAAASGGSSIIYDGSWMSPISIDGSNDLSSLSCSDSSFCGAVDNDGNAIIYAVVPTPTGDGNSASNQESGTLTALKAPDTGLSLTSAHFTIPFFGSLAMAGGAYILYRKVKRSP